MQQQVSEESILPLLFFYLQLAPASGYAASMAGQSRMARAGCRSFFLHFAYVCQSIYPQTVLSFRPNSLSGVFPPNDMAASYAHPAFIESVFAAEVPALRQPTCKPNSGDRGASIDSAAREREAIIS